MRSDDKTVTVNTGNRPTHKVTLGLTLQPDQRGKFPKGCADCPPTYIEKFRTMLIKGF
jgi:hypothetical protein